MHLSHLTYIAKELINRKAYGDISVSVSTLVDKTLNSNRECLPLHTKGVSLARAISCGYYQNPEKLEQVRPGLYRDGMDYLYFEGIRIANRVGPVPHAEFTRLIDKCNTLLANGVLVTGRTVENPMLDTLDASPAWSGALLCLNSAWKHADSGDWAYVFLHQEPMCTTLRVLTQKGFWREEHSQTNVLTVYQRLKSLDFVEGAYPETVAQLEENLNASSITHAEFLIELNLEFLA